MKDGYASVFQVAPGTLTYAFMSWSGEIIGLPVVVPLEQIVTRVQTSGTGETAMQIIQSITDSEGGWSELFKVTPAYLFTACQPAIQACGPPTPRLAARPLSLRAGCCGWVSHGAGRRGAVRPRTMRPDSQSVALGSPPRECPDCPVSSLPAPQELAPQRRKEAIAESSDGAD